MSGDKVSYDGSFAGVALFIVDAFFDNLLANYSDHLRERRVRPYYTSEIRPHLRKRLLCSFD
jgi:hypothetical protein